MYICSVRELSCEGGTTGEIPGSPLLISNPPIELIITRSTLPRYELTFADSVELGTGKNALAAEK